MNTQIAMIHVRIGHFVFIVRTAIMTGPVQTRLRGCTGYVSILWLGCLLGFDFPAGEDKNGGMAIECSGEHLCSLYTNLYPVILNS